ncbi:MAG: hypothetical protein ACPG6V_12375 [Flavobacteriales bacterium]
MKRLLCIVSLIFLTFSVEAQVFSDSILVKYLPRYLEKYENKSYFKENKYIVTVDENISPFLDCDGRAMTLDYGLCHYEEISVGNNIIRVYGGYYHAFETAFNKKDLFIEYTIDNENKTVTFFRIKLRRSKFTKRPKLFGLKQLNKSFLLTDKYLSNAFKRKNVLTYKL